MTANMIASRLSAKPVHSERPAGEYRLTRYEQETIFSWMHQEPVVLISSTSTVFHRKMERWGFKPVQQNKRERHYEVPVSHVRVGRRRLDRLGLRRTRGPEAETVFRWNEETPEVVGYELPKAFHGMKRGQVRIRAPKPPTREQIERFRVSQPVPRRQTCSNRLLVGHQSAKQAISQGGRTPSSSVSE